MHYSYEMSLLNAMNCRMHCDALLMSLLNNAIEIRYPVLIKYSKS